MEEPVHQTTMNETEDAPKVFDYAKIVAEKLNIPFDYKKAYGRQPAIQLKKKTYEELLAQVEHDDSDDSDDEEPVELHASVKERSLKLLTNIPIVHAFNMAETRLGTSTH
ncbi:hypothetical protein L5515_002193 [Caenorhabditis briggsae]|uniref:Uncharacterized protein n=2 Tax=Caenorhabditis briggsae TaxID=6238 RepID=A0AAE9DXC1_CAEBR|nr:hypothetical protein L3Y34_016125 [Caenorhabditis briggsae]UMM14361.1 hypothetical protein L5515_002193 [Caenorhabditis briggsae]